MKRLSTLLILLTISLLITSACANPNRRNVEKYEWCSFVSLLELHGLGVNDCDDETGWSVALPAEGDDE